MSGICESMVAAKQVMWGDAPTPSALLARDHFVARGAREILLPVVGYGRKRQALRPRCVNPVLADRRA